MLSLLMPLLGAGVASAQCITNSDCLWPKGCGFSGAPSAPIVISAPPVRIRNLVLIDMPGCSPVPAGGPFFIVDGFFDVFLDLSTDNGATYSPKRASGHDRCQLWFSSAPGSSPKAFVTEMLQLDISGGTLPPGVLLRESPTEASTGEAQDNPLGGGQFRMNSLVDLFMELSLDGGATWTPSTGPTRLAFGAPSPTPTRPFTWGELKSFYR